MSKGSLLSLRIPNIDQFQNRMKMRAENLDIAGALLRSAVLTESAAKMRIKKGGDPPWIPSKRVQMYGGSTGILTGKMLGGINAGAVQVNGSSGKVSVGVSKADVPYAAIFQRGSGLRAGRSAWTVTIRAKNARALSWVSGGKRYFARNVTIRMPGQVPRPFLYFDDKLRSQIRTVFLRMIQGA
jgi:phage gpG-like protein